MSLANLAGAGMHEALPTPLGPSEVLVRVRACALSHQNPSGPVAGFAGEVVEIGEEVHGLQYGDRVMCGATASWTAEYAVADWGWVYTIPDDMMWSDAAGVSSALLLMHNAVVTLGRLRPGERVLVNGASSDAGLVAMQVAKLMGSSLVIGACVSEQQRARLSEFGADLALDSSDDTWPQGVLNATGGEGVDLTIDSISGGALNGCLRATRVRGRVVNVGQTGGLSGAFDFALHASRRIEYVGVSGTACSVDEVREMGHAVRRDFGAAWAHRSNLQLPLDSVFPIERAHEALARCEVDQVFGRIVLLRTASHGLSSAPARTLKYAAQVHS